jgi:uncharacterized membrane protein
MISVLLGLAITIGLLFLGTHLLQKYGRINNEEFNLLYAGYFSIKAIIKIGEVVTLALLGSASLSLAGGALFMIAIDSLFAYYFFKKSNVL